MENFTIICPVADIDTQDKDAKATSDIKTHFKNSNILPPMAIFRKHEIREVRFERWVCGSLAKCIITISLGVEIVNNLGFRDN